MSTPSSLPERFHEEMLRIYDECTKFGYRPRIFLGMVHEYGGVETAIRLLTTEVEQYGFQRLWEARRLDLSVEALVLREPWRELFTPDILSEAERRLEGSDYE